MEHWPNSGTEYCSNVAVVKRQFVTLDAAAELHTSAEGIVQLSWGDDARPAE